MGKSSDGSTAITIFLCFLGIIFFSAIFAGEHPMDMVFLMLGEMIMFTGLIILIGAPILLLLWGIFTSGRDLYDAFRLELDEEEREKLDNFFLRVKRRFKSLKKQRAELEEAIRIRERQRALEKAETATRRMEEKRAYEKMQRDEIFEEVPQEKRSAARESMMEEYGGGSKH